MAFIRFPENELVATVRNLQGRLEQDRRNLLNILGVQLLSLEKQNFEKKSRGGTGEDGVKWRPLNHETIIRKNLRGKRNVRRKATPSGKARPA